MAHSPPPVPWNDSNRTAAQAYRESLKCQRLFEDCLALQQQLYTPPAAHERQDPNMPPLEDPHMPRLERESTSATPPQKDSHTPRDNFTEIMVKLWTIRFWLQK